MYFESPMPKDMQDAVENGEITCKILKILVSKKFSILLFFLKFDFLEIHDHEKILFTFFVFFRIELCSRNYSMYQQYLFDSEFLFNPAHIGKTDDVNLVCQLSKQFSKFDESPNVQSVEFMPMLLIE